MRLFLLFILFFGSVCLPVPQNSALKSYPWISDYNKINSLIERIKPPAGYELCDIEPDSKGDWLIHLPLKKIGSPVLLFDGSPKNRQDVHAAVIDIDCGKTNLQQCADAVMRLHAEYLFSKGREKEISFNYTSGDKIPFEKWMKGFRPVIKAKKVTWIKSKPASSTYIEFKKYLWNVFNYAGTASLSKELKKVNSLSDIKPGDVFIAGGFPGHAVTVVAVAKNKTGEKLFLLAQSYMPAQEIHILKNFNDNKLSPWYSTKFETILETPEWDFKKTNLMRFN